VELGAGDPFNKGVSRPGALFELELPPLDLQIVAARVQPFELDEHLARAMLM